MRSPRGFLTGRVDVRQVYPADDESAMPPRHKPHTPTSLYGDRPAQRKQRGKQPIPPRRERPPDLNATERGEQLYGRQADAQGLIAVSRLLEGDTAGRLEATFSISSVVVQNTSAAESIVVAGGEATPSLRNALAVARPGRVISVPVNSERVLRFGTVSGAALLADEVAIVTATDRPMPAAAGAS